MLLSVKITNLINNIINNMRNLILIVICVLGMAFTQDQTTSTKNDLMTKIVNTIGVENIVPSSNVERIEIYPSTPLCQSNNVGGDNWVIFEWNGQYYYGMYGTAGYAEVPVTQDFATKYCERNQLGNLNI